MYTVYYKKVEAQSRTYRFSAEKNAHLLETRNMEFNKIIEAINNGLAEVVDHHNPEKYPNQQVFMVSVDDYIYMVPFIREANGEFFLKTIIPSRKAKKRYLKKGECDEIEKKN